MDIIKTAIMEVAIGIQKRQVGKMKRKMINPLLLVRVTGMMMLTLIVKLQLLIKKIMLGLMLLSPKNQAKMLGHLKKRRIKNSLI